MAININTLMITPNSKVTFNGDAKVSKCVVGAGSSITAGDSKLVQLDITNGIGKVIIQPGRTVHFEKDIEFSGLTVTSTGETADQNDTL